MTDTIQCFQYNSKRAMPTVRSRPWVGRESTTVESMHGNNFIVTSRHLVSHFVCLIILATFIHCYFDNNLKYR